MLAVITFVGILAIRYRDLKWPYKHDSTVREPDDRADAAFTIGLVSVTSYEPTYRLLWICFSREFHKVQCYYSVILQIASLTALCREDSPVRNIIDGTYLLLLSANGTIPIAMTFYGLSLVDKIRPHTIMLTVVAVTLSSTSGIHIATTFSDFRASLSGGAWPDVCGGLSPEYMCGHKPRLKYDMLPHRLVLAGAIFCDVLVCVIILRCLLKPIIIYRHHCRQSSAIEIHCALDNLESIFGRDGPGRMGGTPTNQIRSNSKSNLYSYMIHGTIIVVLMFFYSALMYFYKQLLMDPDDINIVDNHDWSFGQIVGIATWSTLIVDLVRHTIGTFYLDSRVPSFAHASDVAY